MFGIERNSMQAVEIAENHVQWHLYVDEMPTGLYIDLHLSDDAETTTISPAPGLKCSQADQCDVAEHCPMAGSFEMDSLTLLLLDDVFKMACMKAMLEVYVDQTEQALAN